MLFKRISLFLAFFAVVLLVSAQNKIIDSLHYELKTHIEKDTQRIHILNALATRYNYLNPGRVKYYATKALKLARQLDYQDGIATAYLETGNYYFLVADHPSAIQNYKKCLKLRQEEKDNEKIAVCYENLANSYNAMGMYVRAMQYYHRVLTICQKAKNQKKLGGVYYNMGNTASKQENWQDAIRYYLKSLKIVESIQDTGVLGFAYHGLGKLYLHKKNYKKAAYFFEKDLKISREIQNNYRVGEAYLELGDLYYAQKKYTRTEKYYEKALEIAGKYDFKTLVGTAYAKQGRFFQQIEKTDEAIKYFEKAIEIYTETNNPRELGLVFRQVADYYKELKSIYKAELFYDKALKISYQNDLPNIRIKVFKGLYQLDSLRNNFKTSLQYHQQYKNLKDSMFTLKKERQLEELTIQYETQQQQKAIEQHKFIVHTQNIQIKVLTATGILLFVLAYISFRSRQKERQSNRLLIAQKEEILMQSEEIQTQSERLRESNARLKKLDSFKDEMMGMIVHDLKNPLNIILGLSENEQVKQAGKQMVSMVLNILDVQKFEDTQIPVERKIYYLNEVVENSIRQVKWLSEQRQQQLNVYYAQNIKVDIDSELIERVLVNLLTNAIKYTPIGESIGVEVQLCKINKGFVKVKVIDSGQGIPEDKQYLVFDKFAQVSAKASGYIRSLGLGLAFCKMAIEAHNGTIGVKSVEGIGSTFWFTLPLVQQDIISQIQPPSVEVAHESTFVTLFTQEERKILKPYIEQLQNYEVYEVSSIKNILNTMGDLRTDRLRKWKKALERSVYSSNELLYDRLTQMKDVLKEK